MSTGRKILVVGSGGREHALALRLLASESVEEVIVCPGNAGTRETPAQFSGKKLSSRVGDPVAIAKEVEVDLVVVGPEVALCDGISDSLLAVAIPCFGPSKAAARLEGSKAFMKAFCQRHGISVAKDVIVTRVEELEAALGQFQTPPVVKADGLCAGKGVVVAESFEEARDAATRMLSGESFGIAGTTVVLEERLLGSEASVHGICDGERAHILPTAQDHKRIFDGDLGPNTGGMGTYAPAPVIAKERLASIEEEVLNSVVRGMKKDGIPFVGTLFAGLMVNDEGVPTVLEYNVRFGDPETEVLMQIIEGDLGEALYQATQGELRPDCLTSSDDHALCVVLAADGYPENPRKGDVITGLEEAALVPGVQIYHAGTAVVDGQIVTSGGRVLAVSARGNSLQEAQIRAYEAADKIHFAGKQLRRDIGYRALS